MAESKMTVEIWSDVMCPFCYLGKRRFANALAEFAHHDKVAVVWKSFQLMPALQTDPTISINQLLAREKGLDLRRAAQMNNQLAQAGQQEGLAYDFDRIVVANTFRAHCFMHFAKAHGRQDEAMERIFRAYFTEGRNVDDPSTLVELGGEVGLDPRALSAALQSGAHADAVRSDIEEARQLGIRGVPFFVFNRTDAVSGAQNAGEFRQTLERTFAEWRQNHADTLFEVVQGQACAVDGECA